MTPDVVVQPDMPAGAPEFVGFTRVEQLAGGEPSVTILFLGAADAALAPTIDRGSCKIGCIGTYPDDTSITCGEARLTPPQKLNGGHSVLDIDDDADGTRDRTYDYDFNGNDYSVAERPPTPFFPEGAQLRFINDSNDPGAQIPDSVDATVSGPAPVGLTAPATGDDVDFAGLDLAWSTGSGDSKAVIQMTASFQGLAMGMPTGAVVRQMTVTCTVDDTGSFTVPSDVLQVLQPGAQDTYFQCGGPNTDQCVTLTVRRENRIQKVVGKTDFTLVGSTASPTLLLTVPVMMMEMP
jgi:hypothetical protein